MKIVTHPITDNQLCINNKEYFGLGVDRVITGIEVVGKTEIAKDAETGLNYERNAVEGKEIYKLSSQKHHNWFFLDLETGSRGWFPGSEVVGTVLSDTDIKAQPTEDSETLASISHEIVTLVEIHNKKEVPESGWCKIKFNEIIGYIKVTSIFNINYN